MTNTPNRLRKSGLTRKLATTAAIVIASTGVMTAQGTIIYSGAVNLDVPLSPKLSLDWNSDGTTDLAVVHTGKGNAFTGLPLLTNAVYAETSGSTLLLADSSSSLIQNLSSGVLVDSSDFFASYPGTGGITFDRPSLFFTQHTAPDPVNGWDSPNPSEGYFGFQFNPTGSQVLYGWAYLAFTAGPTTSARTVTIRDYAYDSSGAGIITGSVPEPSALLLGAAGLSLFLGRRRRA